MILLDPRHDCTYELPYRDLHEVLVGLSRGHISGGCGGRQANLLDSSYRMTHRVLNTYATLRLD